MILPRGITGVNVPKDQPETDAASFREDCRQISAMLKSRSIDRPNALDDRLTNFYSQTLAIPTGEIAVLVNRFHPWVGFCLPVEPGNCLLEFVDPSLVRDLFAALGRYRLLSKSELDQPIAEEMCRELRGGERKQIKYWGKLSNRGRHRVGDVIFNFWD